MAGRFFTLRWHSEKRGEFETRYEYTGSAYNYQQGYTLHGWRCRCIAAGKREGLTYRGTVR